MDHLFFLTDVNGPRLTASPGWRHAADWAVRSLAAWGASNPHIESWGRFGRPWSVEHFEVSLTAPSHARLEGAPLAWCRGTAGPVSGTTVLAPFFPDKQDEEDVFDMARYTARIRAYKAAWKGKLRGHFVLLMPPRDLELPRTPEPVRYDDKKLGEVSDAPDHAPPEPWTWPLKSWPRDPKKRAALRAQLPLPVMLDYWERMRAAGGEFRQFLIDEGVLGVVSTDDRGEGSLIFAEDAGAWEASQPLPPPSIVLSPEGYDRLARLAEKHVEASLRLDLRVATVDRDEEGGNVVAEIAGAAKRDELVIIGAHLDSWHAGTGATDNGAGSAVMLEVVRILKALALPLDRTVRLVLWSGEEQGYYGSIGYVKRHFGDAVTMKILPEHAKVSAYFNLDNGTGKIRGVYLQGNDMARPIFESLLAPFRDEGVTTISIKKTGGTDHESFDGVGLPGFQFIQDPLDYESRTHHSNLDVYEHAQPGDLMQAAAVVASLVYETANRPEMFPRKPVPPPLPPRTPQ